MPREPLLALRALAVVGALVAASPMPALAIGAAYLRGDWAVAVIPSALYVALAASGAWWVAAGNRRTGDPSMSKPANWYVYRSQPGGFWKLDHGRPLAAVEAEGPMSYGDAVRRKDELNDRPDQPLRQKFAASERSTRPLFGPP